MKIILALIFFVCTVFVDSIVALEFNDYMALHKKAYKSQNEYQKRKVIYLSNLEKINRHNKDAVANGNTYKMGVNIFTDQDWDKVLVTHTGAIKVTTTTTKTTRKIKSTTKSTKKVNKITPKSTTFTTKKFINSSNSLTKKQLTTYVTSKNIFTSSLIKASITNNRTTTKNQITTTKAKLTTTATFNGLDWRTRGILNPIQYQGICGSCWAFAATALVESVYAKKTNILLKLSEQDLVDCDVGDSIALTYTNNACNGGWMPGAAKFAVRNGLEKLSDYPYTSGSSGMSGACKFNANIGQVKGAMNIQINYKSPTTSFAIQEENLRQIVEKYGPVAINIYASNALLGYWYKAGMVNILNDTVCAQKANTNSINHSVVIVGYGTSVEGKDYWILRNSWSTQWGDQGYFYLPRGLNYCNLLDSQVYAT